jgi:hypothetical protein
MALLGLQEIDELREELKCREGLFIDFDYAAALVDLEVQIDEVQNVEPQSENEEEEEEEEEEVVVVVEDNEGDGDEQEEEPHIIETSGVAPAPDPSGARTVHFHKPNDRLSHA